MVRSWITLVVALTGLGLPCSMEVACAQASHKLLSNRVVRVFDFDERDDGNFGRLPRYWFVVRAEGYPRHTADRTSFDQTHAVSGKHSLMMRSNGGSAALVLEKGAIAAVPGADYIVTSRIRTAKAKHARARLVGFFLDDAGRPIAGSLSRSALVKSNGQWQRAQLRLHGDFDRAAWIMLRLELLQSQEFRKPVLGEHELYHEDVDVTAWFDDVAIYQLPRVDLTSQSPTNIVRQPDQPTLNLTVRDSTGEKLTASTKLYDHRGKLIDQQTRTLDGRHAPKWRWQPKVDRLGWYWADLQVNGEQGLVARRAMAVAWLPKRSGEGRADARRFGIAAEQIDQDIRPLLPRIVQAIGAGSVITDIWRADMTHEDLRAIERTADPVIEALLSARLGVTLSLGQVPAPIAINAKTDADRPLSLFATDTQHWLGALRATLVRYGQGVDRWQIGRVTNTEAFDHDDIAALHQSLAKRFRSLVPDAKVVLPWSALQALPERASLPLTIHVPVAVRPDHIGAYLDQVKPNAASLVLATLDPKQFDHHQRATDLALRMVHAWRTEPRAMYIQHPWNRAPSREPAALPDPLLGVFANMIDRLGERKIVGQMSIAPGVSCYILDGPGGGALVAWATNARQQQASLDLYLGDRPTAIDIWGNRKALASKDGRHHFKVTATPLFIENVDAKLARFRAGLGFTPAFVESSYKVHSLSLNIGNPWNQSISGKLRIAGLERWKISPRMVPFNIAAGESVRVPVEVTFPVSELAGHKQLDAVLSMDAGQQYNVRVGIGLKIGLRDIDFHPTLNVETSKTGDDVVVRAVVTNRGDQPRSLYAFVLAPDQPRQQRIIARLGPGQSTIKHFRLPGAAKELHQKSVRIGLRELDGTAMVNQKLEVP